MVERQGRHVSSHTSQQRPAVQGSADNEGVGPTGSVSLLQTPGFGRRFLDGKKAQNRFLNLIKAHRKFQNKSLTLSGVNQEETEKTRLLDELVGLIDDYDSMKQSDRESETAKQQQKEISAMYVREQAMLRGRQKIVDTSETSESSEVDGTVGRKRKLIEEVQAKEIALEQERLAFKKLKFEREMEEREKDRQEREKERQE
ncbi:hypothetical protein AC1031_015991 [Aphanomyces cochlioides]|nr:hypothetical protein AC1031_015991 [Aphanomyces cochlioides]